MSNFYHDDEDIEGEDDLVEEDGDYVSPAEARRLRQLSLSGSVEVREVAESVTVKRGHRVLDERCKGLDANGGLEYDGSVPLRIMKQEKLAQELLVDMDLPKAMVRAGYSDCVVQRHRLKEVLRSDHFKKRMTFLQDSFVSKTFLKKDWVLDQAVKVYSYNSGEVFNRRRGVEEMRDASASLRALKMVGEHVDVDAFKGEALSGIKLPDLNINFVGNDVGEGVERGDDIIDLTPTVVGEG